MSPTQVPRADNDLPFCLPDVARLRGMLQALSHTPYTLHPTPYTLHPTPYTLHPTPYTLHPTPYTLHPTPYTLRPTPYTLHHTPDTLHPPRSALAAVITRVPVAACGDRIGTGPLRARTEVICVDLGHWAITVLTPRSITTPAHASEQQAISEPSEQQAISEPAASHTRAE